MPPNGTTNFSSTNVTQINSSFIHDDESSTPRSIIEPKKNAHNGITQQPIIWLNAISIISFHIIACLSFLLTIYKMKVLTILWMIMYGGFAGFGVTAGVHRLWSHRSYKVKTPLKILLLICYASAGMNSLFDWVRDHRVHHKFTETDADPHDARRGFFFSHVGWLMQRKNPEVILKGRTIDMTDITGDPLLRFYNKYFLIVQMIFCYVLPVLIPVYCWNEAWLYAFISQDLLRYMGVLNVTWSVNSFAHLWGNKPYDKRIKPVENLGVAIATLGEGWHNYHHVFPWDYKAAELGNYKVNLTTMWLDLFKKIGQAYDCKEPSPELVQKIILKYGDGSYVGEIPYDQSDKTK